MALHWKYYGKGFPSSGDYGTSWSALLGLTTDDGLGTNDTSILTVTPSSTIPNGYDYSNWNWSTNGILNMGITPVNFYAKASIKIYNNIIDSSYYVYARIGFYDASVSNFTLFSPTVNSIIGPKETVTLTVPQYQFTDAQYGDTIYLLAWVDTYSGGYVKAIVDYNTWLAVYWIVP